MFQLIIFALSAMVSSSTFAMNSFIEKSTATSLKIKFPVAAACASGLGGIAIKSPLKEKRNYFNKLGVDVVQTKLMKEPKKLKPVIAPGSYLLDQEDTPAQLFKMGYDADSENEESTPCMTDDEDELLFEFDDAELQSKKKK